MLHEASIVNVKNNKITVNISLELSGSALEDEKNIRVALNEAGVLFMAKALENLDTDGSPIEVSNTKLYFKGKFPNTYQSSFGEVPIMRNVYQTGKGGQQFVPVENNAVIMRTPHTRLC